MTISERIFEILDQRGMSQKEFSKLTGIAASAISDWKRKKTNPVSNKILTICEVLQVSPYELLSGTEDEGSRSKKADYYVIDKKTELGIMVEQYQSLEQKRKGMMLGYLKALKDTQNE